MRLREAYGLVACFAVFSTASVAGSLLAVGSTSCSTTTPRECTVGAQCPSGACLQDGVCAPVATSDAGEDAVTSADSGVPVTDASADTHPAPPPEDGGCLPDDAGEISRAQVFFQAGLHATYRVAQNVTVNTAGTMNANGSRTWDYSGPLQGDMDVLVTTLPITGSCYSSSFPGAGYSSQLSPTEPLLGVFTANPSSLVLNGVVSETSGTTQTEVTYAPPATTLSFPMSMGSSWTSTSTITGTADGIPDTEYTEEYQSSVDAEGTLITPYATFPVLRVAVLLTRTVDFIPTTTRSFIFMTACFGSVATVTSNSNETTAEFTTAAVIQRLAP